MIRGTFRPEDLRSAHWVHLRPRRGLFVAGVMLLALFAWTAWFSLFGAGSEELDWVRWVVPGLLLYSAFVFGVWLPLQTNRTFKQRRDLHREISFGLLDSGLAVETETGQGVKPWSDFLKWKEGRQVFLLYLSDGMYQILPKRFFDSESEISRLRSLLEQKVARARS